MPIHSIQMVSFRNHEKLEMEFSAGINIIWGENGSGKTRSEEHTSELQSRTNLVCRLLLEKKKKNNQQ